MRINIVGWASEGLRCPDMAIDLSDRDGKPSKVALVQMPNGTGKTTTLELLNATLNGQARKWDEEEVRRFRRAGALNVKGSFMVRLLVDGRPLTIEIVFDFDDGKVGYRTTNPGSGGMVVGYSPPASVLQFLTPHFLKLFVFDGEFAGRLFKPKQAEADGAIDALCQLYLLNDVATFARERWEEKAKQIGGPKTEAALKKLKDERLLLLTRRASVQAGLAKAERSLGEATEAVAELERRIAERLTSVESTRTRFSEAQLAQSKADSDVARLSDRVMQDIRMPLSVHTSFGLALVDLKSNLDNLRLPENTSRQFFEDLLNEPECICGRDMTAGARQEIDRRSKGYLDDAESGTINAMKQEITRFTAYDDLAPDVKLTGLLDDLGDARRLSRMAEQDVRALQQKLIDEGDGQLKDWQDDLKAQTAVVLQMTDFIEKVGAEADEVGTTEPLSLKALEKALRDNDRRLAETTSTVALRRETESITRILKRAGELARAEIKKDLVKACNEKLLKVLANDPLRLDRIDRSLRFAGQDEASVGQTLAVGYTFLMSILNRGNNDFPLIVDSPANPIDEGVRRRVAKLIPELCSQFVGFTINTEKAGFVPSLAQASPDLRFMTLFRKTEGAQRWMTDLPSSGVKETANAVLVEDRDYFMSFDVEEEDD